MRKSAGSEQEFEPVYVHHTAQQEMLMKAIQLYTALQ